MRHQLVQWTVDYGDGRRFLVSVPHAWHRDVSVRFEGPVTYETTFELPDAAAWLVFEAVSYQARVFVDDELVLDHRGLWDAFSVSMQRWRGRTVALRVEVVKNGGTTFPVRDVLSGFLPFVFHTFGGLYRPVYCVESEGDPLQDRTFLESLAEDPLAWDSADSSSESGNQVELRDGRMYVAGEPFYMRGVLTWGWYPDIGHPNPDDATIRRELTIAKALGFNLVKFCLWMPSHRHLRLLREAGLWAWIELPLWAPSSEPDKQEVMAEEIRRIVRQYRHHPEVICWTLGCELSHETPAEFRRELTDFVQAETGCPLVKDNSGGAEMYGGDLREFGTFYDFHPYCDTPFYPLVLDTLLPGARRQMPILLGEFNDIDVHRDLPRIAAEQPFWAQPDPDQNDQGVRWQHDLPYFLPKTRFAQDGPEHARLMESSRRKALFMRKYVHESVRAREAIAGYVITGWRDTPISTAGVVDDWGQPRFSPEEMRAWNGPDCLFRLPTRRPPWVRGGNRPGYLDPYAHFAGQVFFRLGGHMERSRRGTARWVIERDPGEIVAEGEGPTTEAPALRSVELAEVHAELSEPGLYRLKAEFDGVANAWPFHVVEPIDWRTWEGWAKYDPRDLLEDVKLPTDSTADGLIATGLGEPVDVCLAQGGTVLLFLPYEGMIPGPFWREAAYEFAEAERWREIGFTDDGWERWLAVSGDGAVDARWLGERFVLEAPVASLLRIDTRTYQELPVVLRARVGLGRLLATTLRPFGGLGVQPVGISRNPSGNDLLRGLRTLAES